VHDVWHLERAGWNALASGPEDAYAFYDDVLADDAFMVFPGGMVIEGRAALVDAMSGPPWSSFCLGDERVLAVGDGAAIVTYRADAQRAGQGEYTAMCTSAYRRDDDRWQLVFHQQTPF
jgi:hypothetical protein